MGASVTAEVAVEKRLMLRWRSPKEHEVEKSRDHARDARGCADRVDNVPGTETPSL